MKYISNKTTFIHQRFIDAYNFSFPFTQHETVLLIFDKEQERGGGKDGKK